MKGRKLLKYHPPRPLHEAINHVNGETCVLGLNSGHTVFLEILLTGLYFMPLSTLFQSQSGHGALYYAVSGVNIIVDVGSAVSSPNSTYSVTRFDFELTRIDGNYRILSLCISRRAP